MKELGSTVLNWVTSTGLKILVALIILWIAFKLINRLARKVEKKLDENGKLDKTLVKMFVSAGKTLAKCLVVLALVGYLGIDTSGVAALIASLGVMIGLAVNGALGNIAGGVLLLLTRPYKVDDYVEVAGQAGTVEAINLVSTKLVTVDNRVVYVPNGSASASNIVNYTEKDIRRVDHTFAIAYGSDFNKAKEILQAVMEKNEKVLKDPAPFARVCTQSGGNVELTCRAWTATANYWDVYFDLLESSKNELQAAGIAMPRQQVDVHLHQA
ncbi:MAG: mechanosensitive ion channel family protein [Lachnospiraceae bacterium]|nr:mechanosensitive ion channel family protein [Lachnospiraceae bacterium]